MSEVILLSERESNGDTVLVEVFTDEAALREFLRDQIVLDGDTVRMSKAYAVERRQARGTITAKAPTPLFPNDEPFHSVTMPSQNDRHRDRWGNPTVFYGVGVDENGEAFACTCPAFEHYSGPCKHMQDARWQYPNEVFGYKYA